MTTRADLTAAANTAMQAREGTRFCHCVEMTFGQAIRARPSDATKPDTEVSWTGRGDLTSLAVYTSVDDGLTWQRVAHSGDPIPKLAVDDAGDYSAAHAVTTNRRVAARVVFERGSAAVLDSLTLRATYEDGTTIQRAETGAALGTDRVVNVRYDANVGGLIAVPDMSLRFHGNRGAVIEPTVHGGGDTAKSGLHLSHGNYQFTVEGNVIEWQENNDADRKAQAAMAVEGWFYTEKTTGVLCGWRTNPTRITWGAVLDLVETSAAGARVRFRTREWATSTPLVGIQSWSIESPTDSVQLNRWHHVAVSYDGFWATLYLDGVVSARVPLKAKINGFQRRPGTFEPFGIIIPTNAGFVMGRHPTPAENIGSTANSFQGRLSEWRLYSQALSPGAILQRRFRRLSDAEAAVIQASDGLAAYYRFDTGAGRTVPDATGNGNDLAWDQQQVGGTQVPTQLAWLPFTEIWRGFPSAPREILPGIQESRDRAPGRQTAILDLDAAGDVLRATDAPFNVVFDGKTFTGVGTLGQIDAVQEAGDLTPTSARLSLSGIPTSLISLALAARYLDRPCRIWQVTWDEDGTQLDPFLVFDGRIDEMNVALGQVGTVDVSAESYLRNWRRPKHRRWNDESQRALWPDDHGLQFLAEMVDRQVWWPVRVTAADAGWIAVGTLVALAAVGAALAWGLG